MPRSHRGSTLLLCVAPLLAVATPTQTAAKRSDPELVEYARQSEGSEWLGIYMLGKKVGWLSDTVRLAEWNGETVLEQTSTMFMRIGAEGEIEESESLETSRYALHGHGHLVAVDSQTTEDGRITTRTARRDGDALVVKSTTGESETERRLVLEHVNLRTDLELQRWLEDVARRGEKNATHSTWGLDLTIEQPETEESVRYRGTETRLLGGVRTEVHRLRATFMGARAEVEMTGWNQILRMRVGGLIEARREPRHLAQATDTEVPDLFALTGVKVDGELSTEQEPAVVVLEVEGVGEFEFPVSSQQQVERVGDSVRVTLRASRSDAPAAPLAAEERARCLAGSVRYPVDDNELVDAVRRIVKDPAAPAAARAEAIFAFVHGEFDKSYGKNAEDAAAVLHNGGGDCSEHALLFVALLRTAGIPAREITGLVPIEYDPVRLGYHAWAEYHDGERWIEVDPTWGQKTLDATHLRLAFADDLTWFSIVENVALSIVEVR